MAGCCSAIAVSTIGLSLDVLKREAHFETALPKGHPHCIRSFGKGSEATYRRTESKRLREVLRVSCIEGQRVKGIKRFSCIIK
jgi:hypothetical protein